jgi:hypothetical protein
MAARDTRGGVMLLAFAALLTGMQTAQEPVQLRMTGGDTCTVRLDGVELSDAERDRQAHLWVQNHRGVRITETPDTSYRCIGAVIFRFQQIGLGGVTFVADPARAIVRIVVPPGRCRMSVDGRPMTFAHFRIRARRWAVTQPDVHFEPSPRASYRCVYHVLGEIRRANLTRLGFIGNEALSEKPQ